MWRSSYYSRSKRHVETLDRPTQCHPISVSFFFRSAIFRIFHTQNKGFLHRAFVKRQSHWCCFVDMFPHMKVSSHSSGPLFLIRIDQTLSFLCPQSLIDQCVMKRYFQTCFYLAQASLCSIWTENLLEESEQLNRIAEDPIFWETCASEQ